MTLVDQNDKPIAAEPAVKEAKGNGHAQKDPAVMDVRAMPTGTLVYNLIRQTCDEVGLENELNRMEAMKQMQRMVALPPQVQAQYDKIAAFHQEIVRSRYIIAREINQRFADVDAMRREKEGVDLWVPKGDEPVVEEEMEAGPPLPSTEDVLAGFGNLDHKLADEEE
jgi:hypothetical protein